MLKDKSGVDFFRASYQCIKTPFMMEGNTGIDHIHILVSIPPKYSATIAGYPVRG